MSSRARCNRNYGGHPFFVGYKHIKYVWCLHCECVWPKSDWISNRWHCPGVNCDGSPLDAWPYESNFLTDNYPDSPKNPVPGFHRPLYSDCSDFIPF